MFTQRRSIRRLAAQVLLAWLFALATGIVNACVIAPGTPSSLPVSAVTSGDEGHAAAAHAPGCHECEDEGPAAGHPPGCAKFCADEASSVPAAKQVHDVQPLLGIAMVPTMALAVAGSMDTTAIGEGVLLPPPRTSVPIAYLRLTL